MDSTPPKAKRAAVPVPAPKPAPAPPPTRPARESRADEAKRQALHAADVSRFMNELGGGAGGGAAAPHGAYTSSGHGYSQQYGAHLRAVIKPNIVLTQAINGNPVATVEVHCSPDGRIIATRLLQSSGDAVWDEVVLQALQRTEVLPADEHGRIPQPLTLDLRPLDH